MPVLDKSNAADVARYENFIKSSPYGRATQDMNCSQVKNNWESDYVYLEENGEIIAALSILSVEAVDDASFSYASRGPVSDFTDIELTKRLIEEAKPVIEAKNSFLLRIDPAFKYDEEIVNLYRDAGFKFRSRETEIKSFSQPRYDMILDLKDKTSEEVLKEFRQNTRYSVRQSIKKGVTTRWSRTPEDLDIFYDMTIIMAERQGITYRPKSYFERLLAAFPDIRIYVSEFEGNPLSTAIAFPYNKEMWYIYGASNGECRNMSPAYNTMWTMICDSIEMGLHSYNFGGIFEIDENDGLYVFKDGFCKKDGPTEWIGELDVVYDEDKYNKFISR